MLKISMMITFDRINWEYLYQLLMAFSFLATWISLVQQWFMIPKFYVSFSFFRALKGFFTFKRGLHQGDHFSLLLFILSEEVSSRGIKKLL